MNRNTKRSIFIILAALAIGIAGVGYFLYNKGPVNVKNSKGIKVEASDLYVLYETDTAAAQKKFSGRILEVTGVVNGTSTNQQNEQVLLLKTNAEGGQVNCTMEETAGPVKVNDKITIKGICTGMGQGDPDLGIMADVYLTRCLIVK